MDTKQRNILIKNIEHGIWTLSDADYDRLIATLQAATTDEQVLEVHAELNRLDPPVQW
jgi:hypothetical protein